MYLLKDLETGILRDVANFCRDVSCRRASPRCDRHVGANGQVVNGAIDVNRHRARRRGSGHVGRGLQYSHQTSISVCERERLERKRIKETHSETHGRRFAGRGGCRDNGWTLRQGTKAPD